LYRLRRVLILEANQMKSLGFIPLGVVLLAGALAAQGRPVPPFQIPAIREAVEAV
jgi:hypothetical protein